MTRLLLNLLLLAGIIAACAPLTGCGSAEASPNPTSASVETESTSEDDQAAIAQNQCERTLNQHYTDRFTDPCLAISMLEDYLLATEFTTSAARQRAHEERDSVVVLVYHMVAESEQQVIDEILDDLVR